MRLANVAVKKGDEASVFMLGKGVLFEQCSNEQFNVMEQVNQFEAIFMSEGYVWNPTVWRDQVLVLFACMDDLYELSMEADKVLTFWYN